jgi:hypothetical protein
MRPAPEPKPDLVRPMRKMARATRAHQGDMRGADDSGRADWEEGKR